MSTSIAKMHLRQVPNVQGLLINENARSQLAAVAARHMNPERLMRVTANAIRTTPKLQDCEPLSFLGALMQCAALGLEPNTVLGHAYLIPFDKNVKDEATGRWNKVPQVQLVVGYKGLIDLARRSGHITSISANIHYSDDELWDYEEGTEARLRHRPGPQDGDKLHAYAIAKFTDGGHAYVVLPWAQVIKIRDGSQGYQSAKKFGKLDSNPWATHEDAMAKKTAIRALSKYLPLSVEFSDAVQIDHDGGAQVDYAGFAMNPDGGATIEGEFVEGEADAPEAQDEPEPEPERKPAPRAKEPQKPRERTDYTPAPAEETKAAGQPKSQPQTTTASAPAAEADPKHVKVFEQIENDLTDGAPPAGVRKFYGDKLAIMEAEAPDLFAKVSALMQQHEAEA